MILEFQNLLEGQFQFQIYHVVRQWWSSRELSAIDGPNSTQLFAIKYEEKNGLTFNTF